MTMCSGFAGPRSITRWLFGASKPSGILVQPQSPYHPVGIGSGSLSRTAVMSASRKKGHADLRLPATLPGCSRGALG
jgi:hypothetical protein